MPYTGGQRRHPAGSSRGGEFAGGSGGSKSSSGVVKLTRSKTPSSLYGSPSKTKGGKLLPNVNGTAAQKRLAAKSFKHAKEQSAKLGSSFYPTKRK